MGRYINVTLCSFPPAFAVLMYPSSYSVERLHILFVNGYGVTAAVGKQKLLRKAAVDNCTVVTFGERGDGVQSRTNLCLKFLLLL